MKVSLEPDIRLNVVILSSLSSVLIRLAQNYKTNPKWNIYRNTSSELLNLVAGKIRYYIIESMTIKLHNNNNNNK